MNNKQLLDTLGQQTFILDTSFQAQGITGVDPAYSNKYFILTNSKGAFISLAPVPKTLIEYYNALNLDIAQPHHTIAANETSDSHDISLINQLSNHPFLLTILKERSEQLLVPFMIDDEVETFSKLFNFNVIGCANKIPNLGNKARLQEALEANRDELLRITGYDLVIPSVITTRANATALMDAFSGLSKDGTHSIVISKPVSAVAQGIWISTPEHGVAGFLQIIEREFTVSEEILLRPFIPHDFSPSLQGGRLNEEDKYLHLYISNQHISYESDKAVTKLNYDGHEISLQSINPYVHPSVLTELEAISKALGSVIIERQGIIGIVGFDAIISLTDEGHLSTVAITELNTHIPGSVPTYVAMHKLFPSGFDGIVHYCEVSLQNGQTANDFMSNNHALLLKLTDGYGIFPLNLSYKEKAAIVIFARDAVHLNQIKVSLK